MIGFQYSQSVSTLRYSFLNKGHLICHVVCVQICKTFLCICASNMMYSTVLYKTVQEHCNKILIFNSSVFILSCKHLSYMKQLLWNMQLTSYGSCPCVKMVRLYAKHPQTVQMFIGFPVMSNKCRLFCSFTFDFINSDHSSRDHPVEFWEIMHVMVLM